MLSNRERLLTYELLGSMNRAIQKTRLILLFIWQKFYEGKVTDFRGYLARLKRLRMAQ